MKQTKDKLKGKKIAFLATNGFEQSELFSPKRAVEEAGGEVVIVSPESGKIKSWKDGDWSESIAVDKTISEVIPMDFDGLVIPGGQINPDILRNNQKVVKFVKGFFDQEKRMPVAAICHGPWLLVEAGVVKDMKVTSYGSIKTDLINAGADWIDQEVVVDNGVVTSRSPEDLDAFCDKVVEELCEGAHAA